MSSNTDPIADFLTRIRNGIQAAHETVEIPSSGLKTECARILREQGYINGYEVEAPLPSVEPPAATPSSRPGRPPPPPPPAPARRTFKTIRVDGKGMRVASGVKDPQEARVSVAAPQL